MTLARSIMLGTALVALTTAGCAAPPGKSAPSSASADGVAQESITNTQEAGVDEGGIVKAHGEHLVVLRRGRLFTVHLGDAALRPIAYVDLTPTTWHDAWYDEMLIHGDTIVVIGYSYGVDATEIVLVRIDDAGGLVYHDTYFLDSNDYYSSRNYASRLLGDQLVFYMPYYGSLDDEDGGPRLGHWTRNNRRTRKRGDWNRLMDSARLVPSLGGSEEVLHSVVTCDLSAARLGCQARGILGGYGRSFYVSSEAVYVWTHEGRLHDWPQPADHGTLYRLPLREGPIGAMHVRGAPIDQFSFREADGFLNVVLRSDGPGDAMWGPERSEGDLGLLRISLQALQTRGERAPRDAYSDLPDVEGPGDTFQNRFVGDVLLYGEGSGWGPTVEHGQAPVFVHRYAADAPRTWELTLPHGVDRIEPIGTDGLVVGSSGEDLHFSALRLGAEPTVASRFVLPQASQGELRSHGFFFKPSAPGQGTLGLPVRRWDAPGYEHLSRGSAEIVFLGLDDLRLSSLGSLASDPAAGREDACRASCIDWYGNARPIFYRGRVFALLGYELVEGRVVDGGVQEVRRVDMSRMIAPKGLRHAG